MQETINMPENRKPIRRGPGNGKPMMKRNWGRRRVGLLALRTSSKTGVNW